MSSIANSPDLVMKLLQQQNVKRDMFEKLEKTSNIGDIKGDI